MSTREIVTVDRRETYRRVVEYVLDIEAEKDGSPVLIEIPDAIWVWLRECRTQDFPELFNPAADPETFGGIPCRRFFPEDIGRDAHEGINLLCHWRSLKGVGRTRIENIPVKVTNWDQENFDTPGMEVHQIVVQGQG